MGRDRFQEEAVLAAVKPLKTANLTPLQNRAPSQNLAPRQDLAPRQNGGSPQNEESGTSLRDSSFRLAMVDANKTETQNASETEMERARTTEARATDIAKANAIAPATEMSGLESLFRQHHDRVFRAAHRVTGSAADAEDVLQTVFLRLARSQETQSRAAWGQEAQNQESAVFGRNEGARRLFEWSDNPEAYLSRAAINASLDLLRKQKRSKAVAMDDVEQQASMATSALIPNNSLARSPEAHHEDRELRNLIREAVARLGEKAGAMFALRYFEGLDNGEIARMMNTSALVVGVTLHRARTRLRKEIGKYLSTHGEKGDLSA
jgi:RNA polymerase sigma-70 factor (ECF subfamily)